MVDANSWYIVVKRKAVSATHVEQREILQRLCSGNTTSRSAPRFMGQRCTFEDDGRCLWHVTYSNNVAPDGVKRIAYVINGHRC